MHDPAVRIWLNAFLDHWLAAGTAPGREVVPDRLSA
jgi:GMP synthase (glutamine-hydrolysing)